MPCLLNQAHRDPAHVSYASVCAPRTRRAKHSAATPDARQAPHRQSHATGAACRCLALSAPAVASPVSVPATSCQTSLACLLKHGQPLLLLLLLLPLPLPLP
jgi:hypothetical protein